MCIKSYVRGAYKERKRTEKPTRSNGANDSTTVYVYDRRTSRARVRIHTIYIFIILSGSTEIRAKSAFYYTILNCVFVLVVCSPPSDAFSRIQKTLKNVANSTPIEEQSTQNTACSVLKKWRNGSEHNMCIDTLTTKLHWINTRCGISMYACISHEKRIHARRMHYSCCLISNDMPVSKEISLYSERLRINKA